MLRLCYTVLLLRKESGQLSKISPILSQYFSNRLIGSTHKQLKVMNTKVAEFNIKSSESDKLKSSVKTKYCKDILEYLDTKPCLRNVLPEIKEKYIKKRYKYPDSQFLVDEDIASKFGKEVELIDAIRPELLKGDSHIFEVNPGPGVITKQLLLSDIKHLQLFESDANFILNLKSLVLLHGKKVKITNLNFLHLGTITYQDRFDNGARFHKIMEDVEIKKWEDSSPVIKLIGTLPPRLGNNSFIKYLIYTIIFQCGLVNYGRPELYVIMNPASYLQLTCNGDDGYVLYRSSTVLFSLLFENKIIKKIPRNSIIPWCLKYIAKKRHKLNKVNSVDTDKMYFVKISPRRDLFSIVRPELLKPFWYFLRHSMMSRKNRVIPMLESWIPGCGPRLISDGLTIFTEFGDLSPPEILNVFNRFVSWPEFNSCPFLASMESALLKMESSQNEDVLEDEIEDIDDDEIEAVQTKNTKQNLIVKKKIFLS